MTTAALDVGGNLFLTERVPYRYRSLNDNIVHSVVDGDTLDSIAAKYYSSLDNGDQFWWVIADFQPDPIIDPTRSLQSGTNIVVPSIRTLVETILSEDRREEFTP